MTNKATKLLAKRKLKVFTIESASAGYILHRLSLSPYSGKVLLGGIVCYDLSVKTDLLNIPVHLIEQYSPESIEITRYLIEHTQALFDADIYIACTGLLKRGGSENAQKPVGTFFIVYILIIRFMNIAAYAKVSLKKNYVVYIAEFVKILLN
jgi:nicotinamide-nucleotide amidase